MTDLEHLYSELRNSKFTTMEAFSMYLSVINQQMLAIDIRIDHLWDELLNWVPTGIIQVQEWPFSVTLKLSLSQWLEEIKHSSPNGLLSQPDDKFILPPDFHHIEIWGGQKLSLWIKMKTEVITVDRYWQRIFTQLDKWQKIAQAEFQIAYWELKNNRVDFVTKWKGDFDYIEQSKISEFLSNVWRVGFSEESPVYLSKVSNAFLLRAQLSALNGGNRLTLIELKDNLLTMSLQMTRADTEVSDNSGPLISEAEINLFNKYIYSHIVPGYLDTSKQLEAALSSQIDQLNSYAKSGKIDNHWVVKFQDTLNELSLIRENLAKLGGSG